MTMSEGKAYCNFKADEFSYVVLYKTHHVYGLDYVSEILLIGKAFCEYMTGKVQAV